jgi:hypothetical protein
MKPWTDQTVAAPSRLCSARKSSAPFTRMLPALKRKAGAMIRIRPRLVTKESKISFAFVRGMGLFLRSEAPVSNPPFSPRFWEKW